MGKLITVTENKLRLGAGKADERGLFRLGVVFTVFISLTFLVLPALLLFFTYRMHLAAGFVLESLLIFQLIAVKDLRLESMKVFERLKAEDLEGARKALSMIVGRDTGGLDKAGITRAAVETVAENTADGAVSPFFYIALGGGAMGSFYKAVNTMDSMVGYQNERYRCFGRAAAKLDDALNFIPSRLSALLFIAGSVPLRFDAAAAYRIWKRDRRKHASPNSAQTEAACAGALGLRLAGPAYYQGVLEEKPYIGDAVREIETEDIKRANRLLYLSAFLALILAVGVRVCFMAVIYTVSRA
jgi:adenosylcobinamide-phosphate synthase